MTAIADFGFARYEDGVLNVATNPSVPVGGWTIRCTVLKRFGGTTGLVVKYAASGYCNGESGITVTNSGAGLFQVQFNSKDFSGMAYGAYAYTVERLDGGQRTETTRGYILLSPGTLP